MEKLQVVELSSDFRRAVRIVPVADSLLTKPPRAGHVIVKNHFVGINASDVNFTAGKYIPGMKVPCDCGFESVGTVVSVGPDVTSVSPGSAVITLQFGAFSNICEVPLASIVPVPRPDPTYMALYLSALTAYVSIMEMAQPIHPNSVALVTAAAGGTGQFAVQILAKIFGCQVIGTCSSDEKVEFLRSIGCSRPVNYKKEVLTSVLKKEFPKGLNVVYECVGGEMFDAVVNHLAPKGKIIVVGGVSQYEDGSAWGSPSAVKSAPKPPLQMSLLTKSATVSGFFLPHFSQTIPKHFSALIKLHTEGLLTVGLDPTSFVGIRRIPDAVDHMYKGQNVGKVIVDLREAADTAHEQSSTGRSKL